MKAWFQKFFPTGAYCPLNICEWGGKRMNHNHREACSQWSQECTLRDPFWKGGGVLVPMKLEGSRKDYLAECPVLWGSSKQGYTYDLASTYAGIRKKTERARAWMGSRLITDKASVMNYWGREGDSTDGEFIATTKVRVSKEWAEAAESPPFPPLPSFIFSRDNQRDIYKRPIIPYPSSMT